MARSGSSGNPELFRGPSWLPPSAGERPRSGAAAPGWGMTRRPRMGTAQQRCCCIRTTSKAEGFEISGTRAESLTFPNHKGNQVYWDDFNGCREVLMGKTGAERFQGYLLML